MQAGKEHAGRKYSILFRCINCLDCPYPDKRPLLSIYNSSSTMNQQVKHMIKMLEKKNLSMNQICQQLQYVYGNHIINKERDESFRVN